MVKSVYIYESYRKIRTGVPLFGPLGSWRHLDMSTRDSLSCCQQVRNKLASYGEACLVYFGHYRISQAVYTYRSPSLQCGYFLDHERISYPYSSCLCSCCCCCRCSCLKPCPHCRRKVRLSPFSRRFRRQSPFSATVSLFCDSVDRA